MDCQARTSYHISVFNDIPRGTRRCRAAFGESPTADARAWTRLASRQPRSRPPQRVPASLCRARRVSGRRPFFGFGGRCRPNHPSWIDDDDAVRSFTSSTSLTGFGVVFGGPLFSSETPDHDCDQAGAVREGGDFSAAFCAPTTAEVGIYILSPLRRPCPAIPPPPPPMVGWT